MAVAYTDIDPLFARELGLYEAPDGTFFKTFEGDTKRDLHEQMDALTKQVEAGGGSEARRSKIGRNAPCWCGSGLKFKKCHLILDKRPG